MSGLKSLEALFPGPRRSVLIALAGEPERWFPLRELAGRAGLQPKALQPHMAVLLAGGVVREKRAGAGLSFQLDPECPVYAELQSIVAKLAPPTAGRETILVVEDQPRSILLNPKR